MKTNVLNFWLVLESFISSLQETHNEIVKKRSYSFDNE